MLDVRVVEAPSAWPDAEPLALGQEITTVFPAEKEEIAHRFSLTERTLLMFDAIVGESEFTYDLPILGDTDRTKDSLFTPSSGQVPTGADAPAKQTKEP